jgi:uncharacterized protein
MIVISNSTPLIALAKIGKLFLLKEYFGEIRIPEEVYDEVVRRGSSMAGSAEVASCNWITSELKTVGFHLSSNEYDRILSL